MRLANLFRDPPPAYAFEVSEAGISSADLAKTTPQTDFHRLTPGPVSVSPLRDNILMPDELAAAVRGLAPVNGNRRRRDIALILPDYCACISVLDFDSFPADAKEQISLVRFRMKKSVPFDVESAAVSYWAQSAGGKVDVVAAVAQLEIVARYEAPFRAAGMNPGLVTTSSLAALQLVEGRQVMVVAKLSGSVLALMVLNGGVLKLIRCLELGDVAADVYPTIAYVEDQLGAKAEMLLLCGFGAGTEEYQRQFHKDLGIPVEALRSPAGIPGETNAGLMGYLMGAAGKN